MTYTPVRERAYSTAAVVKVDYICEITGETRSVKIPIEEVLVYDSFEGEHSLRVDFDCACGREHSIYID